MCHELRVGSAVGPHTAAGLGCATGFSQITAVMDEHDSVTGCGRHGSG